MSVNELRGRPSDSKAGGGRKDDLGKAPIFQGVLHYFPRALEAVARISEYGSKKYAWGTKWWKLEDGFERYSDALVRHLGKEAIEECDAESGLQHAAHAAWCALGRLEVKLAAAENKHEGLNPHIPWPSYAYPDGYAYNSPAANERLNPRIPCQESVTQADGESAD